MRQIALSQNVVLQSIPDLRKYWVFDITTGDHFSVNSTAFWVLDHISAKPMDFDALIVDFVEQFDVTDCIARKDIEEILDNFIREHIVIEGGVNREETKAKKTL